MLIRLLLIITLGLFSATTFAAAPRYTDNLDGTVTDTTTGIMWKRCSEGQNWTGASCDGDVTRYTWEQARALTSTFAGYNDWRVPNIRELHTITDLSTALWYLAGLSSIIFSIC